MSADSILIRPGTAADVELLRSIEREAGELFRAVPGLAFVADDDPPPPAILLDHVASGRIWVAELDDQAVGYVLASVVDGEGHVDQVSVLPGAAGRGIGAALIDRVQAWSRSAGHSSITLTTFAEVPWNGPYYQRLGFIVIAEPDQGPELLLIRARERAVGLDRSTRWAMRRA